MIDIVPENATGSSDPARMIRAQYQAAGVSHTAPLLQAHGEDTLDLSRFDAAPSIALNATIKTDYGIETER